MSATGPWLDVAGLGLAVLAVALAAWYVVDNWLERERRAWADKRAGRWPQTGEAEESTGAEEILAAVSNPVVDRVVDASTNLVARARRAAGAHHWVERASVACVLLFLTCLVVFLFVPLLLAMALGYLSDSRHDIRLRIIVGLFLIDIALQVIASV